MTRNDADDKYAGVVARYFEAEIACCNARDTYGHHHPNAVTACQELDDAMLAASQFERDICTVLGCDVLVEIAEAAKPAINLERKL